MRSNEGKPVPKSLLSGNEALAQGAWEAGVRVAAAYPGTPSTEILQNLAGMPGVYAEWAPNEKVALEVGLGASLGGARTLVTMKHVGLNVASDPVFTAVYTGVGAGLVLVVADDPGMHSSQNEQDTRNYAAFARLPMLEPSDSAEAREMIASAFDLSEALDLPVLIRSTTRLSHGKTLVERGDRDESSARAYAKNVGKYVMMPGMARKRRVDLDRRLSEAAKTSEESAFTREEMRGTALGVVTSGVAYQFVREALPEVSVLKLGMTFPLPEGRVRSFAAKVDRLVVVEELDPYLTSRLLAMGLPVEDVGLPRKGELTPGAIALAFGAQTPEIREPMTDLPPRPPMLCPGCPHRGVFAALRRMDAVVMGDIGCYTLAALPPLGAMDTCVCMGASIGMAHGLEKSGGAADRPVVAVIGDSTFAHSGLTGLLDMVYNGGTGTVIVLDNRVTAMTGHQDNPFTGRTLMRTPAPDVDVEAVCRALGVSDVHTVDPNLLKPTAKAIAAAVAHEGPSVVIAKAPCALLVRELKDPFAIDEEQCTACGECVRLGCPAISRDSASKAVIDVSMCVGCRQCVQVCKYKAIVRAGAACDFRGKGV
jgi:indolepyruvate ferredoxin oxidoreductase alpha subunit